MANQTIGISEQLHAYVVATGTREPDVLRRLRKETSAMADHEMQIAPEQGALLAMLVELVGATRCLEVGTFTGYSSTAVALALPAGARLTCCDVSEEWTRVARRYWAEAGVQEKVELRLGPGQETLDALLSEGGASAYDFAFVDADKQGYDAYYDRLMDLLRPGGLIAFDNTLQAGGVADPADDEPNTRAIRALNARLHADERISLALLPVADGVTLARKR